MALPTFTVAPVRAAQLQALVDRVLSADKDAHTDRSSATTPTDDPDLFVTGQANAVYSGLLTLNANSNADAAGDIVIRFTQPGGTGALLAFSPHGLDPAIASGDIASLKASCVEITTGTSGSIIFGLSTFFTSIHIPIYWKVGATGGDLRLQWAQGTSNANFTRVRAGSNMLLTQIA